MFEVNEQCMETCISSKVDDFWGRDELDAEGLDMSGKSRCQYSVPHNSLVNIHTLQTLSCLFKSSKLFANATAIITKARGVY